MSMRASSSSDQSAASGSIVLTSPGRTKSIVDAMGDPSSSRSNAVDAPMTAHAPPALPVDQSAPHAESAQASSSTGKQRTVSVSSSSSNARVTVPTRPIDIAGAATAPIAGPSSASMAVQSSASTGRTPSPSPGTFATLDMASSIDTPLANGQPFAPSSSISASSSSYGYPGPSSQHYTGQPSISRGRGGYGSARTPGGMTNGYGGHHNAGMVLQQIPNAYSLYASSAASQHVGASAISLSHYLAHTYLPAMMPSPREYAEKEALRQTLEAMARTVLPGCALAPFGSTANGLSLRNSDMDLCCVMSDRSPLPRSAAELVEALGSVIMKETNFHVRMLSRARIPIIKLTIPPSDSSPLGLACDIGFDNKLALENTNLLLTYVMIDARLRTMVLFIKIWTKRRKINNPYLGTLSSYGYALLVIYYLAHRIPPVDQQQISERLIDGHDTYFFSDLEALRRSWPNQRNCDNVGELLIGFFQFMAHEFRYTNDVISIRSEGGILSKEAKGWHHDIEVEGDLHGRRDNTRFCIEDPFQHSYNVARTVTRDGVYTIRGEFMRAFRLLTSPGRADRPQQIIAELCEEREEGLVPCPPGASFNGRRQSAPQPAQLSSPSMPADYRAWAQASMAAAAAGQMPLRALAAGSSVFEELVEVPPMALPPVRAGQPGAYHLSPRVGQQRSSQPPPNGVSTQHLPFLRRQESSNMIPTSNSSVVSVSPSSASSPQMHERRLSWDTVDGQTQESIHRYFSPPNPGASGLGVSLGPPPSQAYTAPTSPVMRATTNVGSSGFGGYRGYAGSLGSSAGASYSNANSYQRGPRSQSHSASDRTRASHSLMMENLRRPLPQFGTVVSPTVNGLGLFDAATMTVPRVPVAPPNQEERRRPGMTRLEDHREVISFGHVRVERSLLPRLNEGGTASESGKRRVASDQMPSSMNPNATDAALLSSAEGGGGRSLADDLARLDVQATRRGPASVP